MKILKKIIIGVVIFIAVAYIFPAMLLQVPYFQEKFSHKIALYLTKKLDTEVHIKQIKLGFFNKLILKDVYLEDLSGEVLFEAKRVAAGFEFLPILQKKWRFNSIQLFTFQFNLSKDTDDSSLNIQYIIDAFAKKDTTSVNSAIDLRIKQLNLRLGNFSYRVKDKAETPGYLNLKQLSLSDISSKININNFNNQELALQVSRLSFKEQSGLQIKNLNFDFVANENEAKINQLLIELDKSSLLFTDLSANYNLLSFGENKDEPLDFQLKLKTSTISPKEFIPIIPAFSNFDDRITIEGDFIGNENNIKIKNFYFRYYNQIMISANADIQNISLSDMESFYIRGNVSNSYFSPDAIERLINNISQQPFELPEQIKQIKNIRFEGDVNGSLDDLAARGVWTTDLGVIQTNITLGENDARFIKGQISSENLNLEKLLNNNDYGGMTFDIQLDAKQNPDKKFTGSINASIAKLVYKGYTYHNLTMNGEFSPASFEGQLNLNSPEGKITGNGLWVLNGNDSKFDFKAKVSDLQLDKLNLTRKYKQPLLSFELIADLTGDNPDNFIGSVSLNNLQFETEKGIYFLDSLQITSTPVEEGKLLNINSEIITGEISGNYSFKTILPDLEQTFASYLPSLINPNLKYSDSGENDFSVKLRLNDMNDFSTVFELPFSFQGQTDISGKYNGNEIHLDFVSPRAVIYGSHTDSLHIVFDNSDKEAQVNLSGISLQKRNIKVKFNFQLDAANDKINTLLHWGNGYSNYRGDLKLASLFSKKEIDSPIHIETNIMQTDMIFNDSIWTLYPATVIIDSNNIRIDSLKATHKDQFLKINGTVSNNPEELLHIELKKINLEYIFQSLSIPALEFGGIATGFVNAQDLFNTKKMETRLDVVDFAFNTVNFGHLDLTGTWDDHEQGVRMTGNVIKNDSTFVDVDGIIYPAKEEISFNFDAQNADARFLRKYLDKVVSDLTGNLSGHLRLFGYWNTPTVEGDVFARNCRFGIGYLNTFYTFTDSVKCLPDMFIANNISIFDEKRNKALIDGYVKHNLFQNFDYSCDASFTNLMVYNATKSLNPMFNGTAFGNGTAKIFGTEDLINIEVNMQNTDNTYMTLNFMEEPDIEDYDFIRFVSVKNSIPEASKKREDVSNPTSLNINVGPEIKLNLLLNATKDASIDMIMDPISGDKISGNGNGSIQIQYGTKIPLKVTGNYMINSGKYNFSFQQFFLRNFNIMEGSSVSFQGDPYAALLDIKAHCTVNANLEDLDPQLIENKRSARNTIPVSCILLLSGPLNQPSIAFDLDLPGATEELNRQVKSYIRTDDMMNRQIGYLLVLSRFYTPPENMRDNAAIANSNWSYLTSTLSSQISNMLGLISDNFQLGTIFHQSYTGSQTNTEFELLLSSKLLNNRLIFNGNFGYSNNPYTNRPNSFPLIGDFDLEYKLTNSGDIRLKGYNHYNYRNYYSITPEMTQGIGILYRKDFNHLLDLLRKKNIEEKNP